LKETQPAWRDAYLNRPALRWHDAPHRLRDAGDHIEAPPPTTRQTAPLYAGTVA